MIFFYMVAFPYISITKKPIIMYTLDCTYYQKSFETIDALLDDVITSGMDPNYEILEDGESIGETAWDLLEP
jgi:CDP-glycerol glycerophosphotransferase (TagB/SpsB family)